MPSAIRSVVGVAGGGFLPDGRFLYTTDDGNVGIFDLDDGGTENVFLGGDLADLTISYDGRYAYIAQQEITRLREGDYSSVYEAVVHELDLDAMSVRNLTFETNGQGEIGPIDVELAGDDLLVLTDYAGSGWVPFRSLDIATGEMTIRDDLLAGNINDKSLLTQSSDGRYILVQEGNISSGPFHIYDVDADALVASQDYYSLSDAGFGPGSGFHYLEGAISSVAGMVAIGAGQSVLLLDLDLNPMAELDLLGGSGYFRGLAFSGDGDRLYAVSNSANAVLSFDVETLDFLGGYGLPQADGYDSAEWSELFLEADQSRMAVLESRGWNDEATDVYVFDVDDAIVPQASTGSFGENTWFGSFGGDLLTAEEDQYSYADDPGWRMSGGDGSDTLLGGTLADRLSGDRDDDLLVGGEGNDTLEGGGGADLFAMWGPSGRDNILDFAQGTDRIEIAGILAFDQLSVLRVGANVTISWGTQKSVRLVDFDGTLGRADFEFLDGSVEDDEVFGLSTDDELHGLLGNDTMFGGAGSDLMFGGDGDDVIYGDAAS